MKPLGIWFVLMSVLFGGFAASESTLQDPQQVFVFIDSSNPMAPVWVDVQRELNVINARDDSEFALAYGQSRGAELVTTWSSELSLSGVQPFAPCSFDDIDSFGEAAEADERILITTSTSCDASGLSDWQVVILEP